MVSKLKLLCLSNWLSWIAICLAFASAIFWLIAAKDNLIPTALDQMSSNSNMFLRPEYFQEISKSFTNQGLLNMHAAHCSAAAAFSQGLALILQKIANRFDGVPTNHS